jgi:D-alanyl-D-alanine carboxypeptidase
VTRSGVGRLRALIACAVASIVAGTSAAVPGVAAASLQTELDAALAQGRESTGAPAATAALMRCGKRLWTGADGVLDLESGRKATTSAMTVIASSTKPMTAALVFDLVDRKELSLDTRLSRFSPKLPSAKAITVQMLLAHTSGLNEYFDDPTVTQTIANDPDHAWTRDEVLRGITKTHFKPGTRYSYSNSGYVVLGGIIEKVTGKTIERSFRARIADRLGLKSSTFAYHPERSSLFAHPYVREGGSLRDAFAPGVGVPADYWGPVWTDGGVASTAPDLARFGDGLFRGRLLASKTVSRMARLNRFGYAMGIDRKSYRGREWLGHDGAYVGYESEVWYDKTRGITLAVTTNADDSSLLTWRGLVDAYDRAAPSARPCKPSK